VAQHSGKGKSSIYSWFDLVTGVPRADWLPALAPRHAGRVKTQPCDASAWEFYKSDYLRAERPTSRSCYRRLQRAAEDQGWKIPSQRTMERRVEKEVAPAVVTLARHGVDALKKMYPAQERDRSGFHALQAVNADGHLWDVWVEWPDGTIARPMMIAIQDLYSGMFLSWRFDRSENKEAVRLAIGDMVEDFGIPESIYLDNGRSFASKWLTGGIANRFRFKIKDEEPVGLLTQLGVNVHWTLPYSGQSKPIERGFRDFCADIAKEPEFEGAWTGNTPLNKPENYRSKAVKLDVFIRVVDRCIGEHNERPGRLAAACKGRSFAETFRQSYRTAPIKKATDEQRRLWLLAAEGVRAASRDGVIKLLGNRYWDDTLAAHRGQPLITRFDPDNLHDGLHVYRLDGSYLCFADCIEAVGFADAAAARDHGRQRRQWMKSAKGLLDLHRTLTGKELATQLPTPENLPPVESKVVRMATSSDAMARLGAKAEPAPLSDEDQAAADAAWAALNSDDAGADNVHILPSAAAARPYFDTDADFARWIIANPDKADASEKERVAELLENPSFRLLLGADVPPPDKPANIKTIGG